MDFNKGGYSGLERVNTLNSGMDRIRSAFSRVFVFLAAAIFPQHFFPRIRDACSASVLEAS